MECSGLQAVCDFRKIDFYPFFFGGDLLNDLSWNRATLGTDEEKKNQISSFELALRVADELKNPELNVFKLSPLSRQFV